MDILDLALQKEGGVSKLADALMSGIKRYFEVNAPAAPTRVARLD